MAEGVTLLEMLCAMAIILVLAGLILGPGARALQRLRADQWNDRASARLDDTVDQLRRHLAGQRAFGVVTLERIESNHWVSPLEMDFLRDRRVTFWPFSDSDGDGKIIIQVQIERGYWSGARKKVESRIKGDVIPGECVSPGIKED